MADLIFHKIDPVSPVSIREVPSQQDHVKVSLVNMGQSAL